MKRIERNVGIDLLRIVATFMIVALHINLFGNLLKFNKNFPINYALAWIIEIVCFCAVNCYGLISGYVNVDKKWKVNNIKKLYLQVLFYSVLITLLIKIFFPNLVTLKEFLFSLFPVLFKQYWYFTSYFVLFFVMPYINTLINHLSKEQYKKLIITLIILFSIIPTIRMNDLFLTNYGYSPLWLIVLYLIGGYVKMYSLNLQKKYEIIILIISLLLVIVSKFSLDFLGLKYTIISNKANFLITFTSPFILIVSVYLLDLFANLKLKYNKVISIFSLTSFAVYLIHCHPLVFKLLKFRKMAFLETPILLLTIIISIISIYLVCSLIEFIRIYIFKFLGKESSKKYEG